MAARRPLAAWQHDPPWVRSRPWSTRRAGSGKTTVTLGLASAAMAAGHRVLVVDLDPQASSTWVLGGDPAAARRPWPRSWPRPAGAPPCGPSCRAGGATASTCCRPAPASARWEHAGEPRAAAGCARRSSGWRTDYDAVLVDCAPSLGHLTIAGLAAADLAVIVVEPSALGLRGITAVADAIDGVWERSNPELDLAGVIVNKVPGVSAEAERRLDELVRVVGRRAIWKPMIPQRVIATQAIAERRPIHSYGWRATDLIEALRRAVGAAAPAQPRRALTDHVGPWSVRARSSGRGAHGAHGARRTERRKEPKGRRARGEGPTSPESSRREENRRADEPEMSSRARSAAGRRHRRRRARRRPPRAA